MAVLQHLEPLPAGRLWAVTSYFNPCGYRRRAMNYRVFRQHLKVPLVAVELSFDGHYQLSPGDADILIQLRADDVMWQKERLFNVGIAALPRSCDRVALLDCDLVFESDDWPAEANAALERHAVIQPFATSRELARDAGSGPIAAASSSLTCDSLAYGLASGSTTPDVMLAPDKRALGSMCGMAWALHREILERHGVYDACIIGGGDGALASGTVGNMDQFAEYLLFNARRRDHFYAWAEPFHADVGGDIGYCAGAVGHLWHGDIKDRRYRERRMGLAEFDFDPAVDLALDASGAWRWATDKPAMHAFVRDYFSLRNEDGAVAA